MTADEPTPTEAEREALLTGRAQGPLADAYRRGQSDMADRLAQVTAAKERAEAQVERVRALAEESMRRPQPGYVSALTLRAALAETTDAPQEGLGADLRAPGAEGGDLDDGRSAGLSGALYGRGNDDTHIERGRE